MAIGNVNINGGEITNSEVINDFFNVADYNKNETCSSCFHFTTCDGGCPLLRLKEKYTGEHYDTCTPMNGHLEEYLDIYLDLKSRSGT